MALGATLLGAGTVGKEALDVASDETTELRNKEPSPPLDATDLTINDISLNVYKFSENDWDAEVRIDVENKGRRGYRADIPVHIVDEEDNQLDEKKRFDFNIEPNGRYQGSKDWSARNSKIRSGEDVVLDFVEVRSRRLLKSEYADVVQDTEQVMNNEE